jgi:putative ATP-dependent endonuclease of OLD family
VSRSKTLLLFEEPELFLHPPQQAALGSYLRKLAQKRELQVLASTHSPHFISLNVDQIGGILHLTKTSKGRTIIAQVNSEAISTYSEKVKRNAQLIRSECKGNPSYGEMTDAEEEFDKAKHFLWFEPDRCNLFFAEHVLIVERLSEKYVINYLLRERELTPQKEVFVLDAVAKSHIPMFTELLNRLHIHHSVLHDGDDANKNREYHEAVKRIIEDSKGKYTYRFKSITPRLEGYPGLNVDQRGREKAFRILQQVKHILEGKDNSPKKQKLDSLIPKINTLLG